VFLVALPSCISGLSEAASASFPIIVGAYDSLELRILIVEAEMIDLLLTVKWLHVALRAMMGEGFVRKILNKN
jgi:hypothetical protein